MLVTFHAFPFSLMTRINLECANVVVSATIHTAMIGIATSATSSTLDCFGMLLVADRTICLATLNWFGILARGLAFGFGRFRVRNRTRARGTFTAVRLGAMATHEFEFLQDSRCNGDVPPHGHELN